MSGAGGRARGVGDPLPGVAQVLDQHGEHGEVEDHRQGQHPLAKALAPPAGLALIVLDHAAAHEHQAEQLASLSADA